MVVAVRQRAERPVEALAAGVVGAGAAPAVAAPVAERLGELLQQGAVGQDGAAQEFDLARSAVPPATPAPEDSAPVPQNLDDTVRGVGTGRWTAQRRTVTAQAN